MPVAHVNGSSLYYEERGSGLPILLVHGMCGDARVWADQMARLAPRYRVIAYDRRGHSRSSLGHVTQRSVELHADDAAGLIEALGITGCVAVGSSGGGRIVLDVVRRYSHLLQGAVMSEPPVFGLDPEGSQAFFGTLKPTVQAAIAQGGPRAAVDAFFSFVSPGIWSQLPEDVRDRYRDNSVELFGDLEMPQYQITPADLARIDLPCMVVSGAESHAPFRKIARVLAENIPGCQFVELQGSGHNTYQEKPADFAAAIGSFASNFTSASD